MKSKKIIITVVLFCFSLKGFPKDYICYYLINSEIKHSMEEHDRQKDMREKQATNLGLEHYNRNEWDKYENTTSKIQDRLNQASLAIQAIPTSVAIVEEIERIYDVQERIYRELEDAPQWIAVALGDQIKFVDRLQMNIRLMAGIILSYGTINQMEKAERKMLLDFTKDEFKFLRIQCSNTLHKIRIAKRKAKQKMSAFNNWVNKDKKIVQDIIKNAKKY